MKRKIQPRARKLACKSFVSLVFRIRFLRKPVVFVSISVVTKEDLILIAPKFNSNELFAWISQWPPESKDRLRKINESTGSARHVVLTVAYSVYDRNIGRVAQMITSLLLSRMKAERNGKTELVEKINQFMICVHEAIDSATGIRHRQHAATSSVCNRILPVIERRQ